MGPQVTRLTDNTRTLLRFGGLGAFALGVVLVARSFASIGAAGPLGGPSPGAFFAGPLFLMAGVVMLRFGFMGAVAEVVATETAGAARVAGGAIGHGLGDAGIGGGATPPAVKVRCRACGFLESEDARYCSSCRAELA